jgi:hypothetical protein
MFFLSRFMESSSSAIVPPHLPSPITLFYPVVLGGGGAVYREVWGEEEDGWDQAGAGKTLLSGIYVK